MKRTVISLLVASTAFIGLAGTASAHRAWILPSSFTLSGEGQWVTVDAAISNDLFYPNHHALNPASISITAPDGSEVEMQNAASGEIRAMFDFQLEQEGTYKISTGGAPSYFANWMENGERKRARGSLEDLREQGVDKKDGVVMSQNQRSVDSFVTLGAPTTDVFTVTGSGLEFVPVTHPNDVFTGEPVTFSFVLNGEPAEGVEVSVVPGNDRYRDDTEELTLKTDADGKITFTLDRPGPYWFTAETEGETIVEGAPMNLRSAYTATFEALSL
jgi:uncharacterized GH25 family protein